MGCELLSTICTAQIAHHANVTVVAISPDGKTLAAGGTSQYVDLWDIATQQLTQRISTGQTGNMMAANFSPDGRSLATSANDGTLRLWNTNTFQEATPPIRASSDPNAPTTITPVELSPNGAIIAAPGLSGGVLLWDAQTGQARNGPSELAGTRVSSFVFSPDGTTIFASHLDTDKFVVLSGKVA